MHVPFDVFDRAHLIGRFVVFKCVFEFELPRRVRRKCVTVAARPLGVQLQQLVGHVFDRFLDLRLGAGPGLPANAIHLRRRAVAAAVFLNEIDVRDRDIHRIARRVLQGHEIARPAVEPPNPAVSPNAVLRVNNIVADIQIAKGRQCRSGGEPATSTANMFPTEHFLFGEDRNLIVFRRESRAEPADLDAQIECITPGPVSLFMDEFQQPPPFTVVCT